MRGRPPVTRARVLTYWRKHGPCPVMQVVRATGAERAYVKRVLKQEAAKDMPMEFTQAEVDRFMAKVDRTPGHGRDGDCWEWTAALDPSGYALGVYVRGRRVRGTHFALAMAGKPRPGQLLALHSCDNRSCVNPNHLRWGTDAENAEDHRQRGRRGAHWLPDETVIAILRSPGRNIDVARKFGITQSAVCNIRKGRTHSKIHEQYCPMPGKRTML